MLSHVLRIGIMAALAAAACGAGTKPGNQCPPNSAIIKCMTLLDMDSWLTDNEETDLEDFCQLVDDFNECLTDSGITENCLPKQVLGVIWTVDFVCGPGTTVISKIVKCLSSADLEDDADPFIDCQDELMGAMSSFIHILKQLFIVPLDSDNLLHVVEKLMQTMCDLGGVLVPCGIKGICKEQCGEKCTAATNKFKDYLLHKLSDMDQQIPQLEQCFMVIFDGKPKESITFPVGSSWSDNQESDDSLAEHCVNYSNKAIVLLQMVLLKTRCSDEVLLAEMFRCACQTLQDSADSPEVEYKTMDDIVIHLCESGIGQYTKCMSRSATRCPDSIASHSNTVWEAECSASHRLIFEATTECKEGVARVEEKVEGDCNMDSWHKQLNQGLVRLGSWKAALTLIERIKCTLRLTESLWKTELKPLCGEVITNYKVEATQELGILLDRLLSMMVRLLEDLLPAMSDTKTGPTFAQKLLARGLDEL